MYIEIASYNGWHASVEAWLVLLILAAEVKSEKAFGLRLLHLKPHVNINSNHAQIMLRVAEIPWNWEHLCTNYDYKVYSVFQPTSKCSKSSSSD